MKTSESRRPRATQTSQPRRREVLYELSIGPHSLENLLLLSATRRASAADLRFAALVRLEEIRELKDYLHGVTAALLNLIHARRIGSAERNAVASSLMTVPVPRRSRASVERQRRSRTAKRSGEH